MYFSLANFATQFHKIPQIVLHSALRHSSSTSKAFLACFNSSFIDNNSEQRLSFGKSYMIK